jgi:hypothetical protein
VFLEERPLIRTTPTQTAAIPLLTHAQDLFAALRTHAKQCGYFFTRPTHNRRDEFMVGHRINHRFASSTNADCNIACH